MCEHFLRHDSGNYCEHTDGDGFCEVRDMEKCSLTIKGIPMSWEEWKVKRRAGKAPCRVLGNAQCIPLRDDVRCWKCCEADSQGSVLTACPKTLKAFGNCKARDDKEYCAYAWPRKSCVAHYSSSLGKWVTR